MKNGEKLLEAFGNIDDKFILETEEIKEKKEDNVVHLFNWYTVSKVVGVAACLVLLIAGGLWFSLKNKLPGEEHVVIQIVNPITKVDSVEELQKYFSAKIPILNKEVNEYMAIGYGDYAEHARIKYSDGTTFDMDLTEEDASGIYGGEKQKEETINGILVKFYKYEEINYATWTKDNIAYSYADVTKELDSKELSELIK